MDQDLLVWQYAETWNGSSWTEVSDLNAARRFLGGCALNSTSDAYFLVVVLDHN